MDTDIVVVDKHLVRKLDSDLHMDSSLVAVDQHSVHTCFEFEHQAAHTSVVHQLVVGNCLVDATKPAESRRDDTVNSLDSFVVHHMEALHLDNCLAESFVLIEKTEEIYLNFDIPRLLE